MAKKISNEAIAIILMFCVITVLNYVVHTQTGCITRDELEEYKKPIIQFVIAEDEKWEVPREAYKNLRENENISGTTMIKSTTNFTLPGWKNIYIKEGDCFMPTDCFDKPDLKGCKKVDCNWCCGNTCTLAGCLKWDEEEVIKFKKRYEVYYVNYSKPK